MSDYIGFILFMLGIACIDSTGPVQIIAVIMIGAGFLLIIRGGRSEKKNNHGDDHKHDRAQFSNYERARRRARRNKSNG